MGCEIKKPSPSSLCKLVEWGRPRQRHCNGRKYWSFSLKREYWKTILTCSPVFSSFAIVPLVAQTTQFSCNFLWIKFKWEVKHLLSSWLFHFLLFQAASSTGCTSGSRLDMSFQHPEYLPRRTGNTKPRAQWSEDASLKKESKEDEDEGKGERN